jgi:putative nucleotidyltransferase with HDIG domain
VFLLLPENKQKISKYTFWSYFEENSKKLRCITVLFIVSYIILYESIIPRLNHPLFFNLMMVMVGISLFDIVPQMIISFCAAWAFSLLEPFKITDLSFFIIQWVSYFIISYVISYLIRTHIHEYRNNANFIKTLARTIEFRDKYTACHSENVAKYALAIAEKLNYTKKECNTIFMGALLHDIGKIGISDQILNKPTKLTKEEYMCIKQHPIIGYDMLKSNQPFQDKKILDIILYHHERYDGKGYPNQLKGNEIPRCAAIVSVADAFDAMASKRVYHEKYDLKYAINELIINAGSQFDPKIVNVFIEYITDNTQAINDNRKNYLSTVVVNKIISLNT